MKGTVKNGASIEAAKSVGTRIAERAKEAKVDHIVFDRGGYLFHGRIKALADAARAAPVNSEPRAGNAGAAAAQSAAPRMLTSAS